MMVTSVRLIASLTRRRSAGKGRTPARGGCAPSYTPRRRATQGGGRDGLRALPHPHARAHDGRAAPALIAAEANLALREKRPHSATVRGFSGPLCMLH